MTIIETAKPNGLDPQAYLADVLDRIYDHKINTSWMSCCRGIGMGWDKQPTAKPRKLRYQWHRY